MVIHNVQSGVLTAISVRVQFDIGEREIKGRNRLGLCNEYT